MVRERYIRVPKNKHAMRDYDYEEEVLELSEIPVALDVINQLMENSKCQELVKLRKC